MTQYICTECGLVVRAGTTSPPQHCGAFMNTTEVPECVLEYSRNHQRVYHGVREHEPIVGIDLVHELELSPGTVYPALQDLDRLDVVEHRPSVPANHGKQWATDPDAFDDHSPDYESVTP